MSDLDEPPREPRRARGMSYVAALVVLICVGVVVSQLVPPRQRPSTLPDGARLVDEDADADGSYDLHVVASEGAFVRWVALLGMHEIDAQPRTRRWEGPNAGGCRTSAYFVSMYELGSWGVACGDPLPP